MQVIDRIQMHDRFHQAHRAQDNFVVGELTVRQEFELELIHVINQVGIYLGVLGEF